VRCWTFPGNTADTQVIRTVKDDLTGSDTWTERRRDEFVGSLSSSPGCGVTYAAPAAGCCAPPIGLRFELHSVA